MKEDRKHFYKCRMISGKRIPFENSFIKNITLEDIFEMSEEEFYKCIIPFCLSLDLYTIKEEMYKKIKLFDVVINNDEYCDALKKILKFMFDEDVTINKPTINHYGEILIGGLVINRDNYDELSEIIMLITKTSIITKSTIDKKEATSNDEKMNSRLKAYYEGKRKFTETKKNIGSSLYNVYKYVANMDKDYNKTLSYNITQLYDRFYFLNEEDRYRFNLNMATNPFVDAKNIDLEPLYKKTSES